MNETVLTIIFVAGVTVFFSYLAMKQKKSAWKGILIDKKIKTVGSDFFLLNKTIIPKYKNAAYNALAMHAPVASASMDVAKMSQLLEGWWRFRVELF